MQGLGLSEFLSYDDGMGGGRSRGDWLRFWTKDPGKILVWLHPGAAIYPVWRVAFPTYASYKDKDTGSQVEVLRWSESYVGWDPPVVYQKQNFYADGGDGPREVPPLRDPFQRMKEWLRSAESISVDAVVFRWVNPKTREKTEWTRGHASGLVKRGKSTFGHKLDAGLEYLFTVVDHQNAHLGPVKTWEKKSLGDRMRDAIVKRLESLGEEDGDVFKHPVAFQWKFNKDADSPGDYYDAFPVDRVQATGDVTKAFDAEPPDLAGDVGVRNGDAAKIRAAFEVAVADGDAAAQITAGVLDDVFGDQEGGEAPVGPPPKRPPQRPPPSRGKPQASYADAARTVAGAERKAEAAKPSGRRRAATQVKLEPCDECGVEFPENAPACPACGTRYEVDGPPAAPTAKAPPKNGAAANKSSPSDGKEACWACGAPDVGKSGQCPKCSVELGDEAPF